MADLHLHHVEHSGANKKYYLAILNYIHMHPEHGVKISKSKLSEFIEKGVPKGTDVLSYQTFPDETHKGKFNPKVIYQSDMHFRNFSGRKILVDSNDCGDKDAYSRMHNGRDLPRVKCFPSKWFLSNYNVILLSTVSAFFDIMPDKYDRTITISCKFGRKADGFYGHRIREEVVRYLEESFSHLTDFTWVPDKAQYFKEVSWTKIVVGAPGWGRYNSSYWAALRAGTLLFCYRALNEIKLFPHSDLIDGDDYVSYDMFDFKMKLERILFDPKEYERIRNNGRQKFAKGLNVKKSALQFVKYLKGE